MKWLFSIAYACYAAWLSQTTFARSALAQEVSAEAIAHNPSLAGPRPSPALPAPVPKIQVRKSVGFVFRPFGIAMGLGGGGLALSDSLHERELVGKVGGGQIDLRLVFPYALFIEGGIASGPVKDRGRSFHETACSEFGGECGSYESGISAVMNVARVGLLQRLFVPYWGKVWQLSFVGGFGYRRLTLTREIEDCVDCSEQTLNLRGGYFMSPELELAYAVEEPTMDYAIGLKFAYERYLSGDIESGAWLSAFVELM